MSSEEKIGTDILDEAARLVNGDRNHAYGPPTQDFARSAAMVTAYLSAKLKPGESIALHDIAVIVCCIKLSRLSWSPGKRDNWVDIAGYTQCGWACVRDAVGWRHIDGAMDAPMGDTPTVLQEDVPPNIAGCRKDAMDAPDIYVATDYYANLDDAFAIANYLTPKCDVMPNGIRFSEGFYTFDTLAQILACCKHTTIKPAPAPAPSPTNDTTILDCGCTVMRGWRCPVHGQP